jgi:peptidyl-prolyl cis-trans isomerase D
MFDLFRSRDKAVRILLGGLLGVVALSMLIYLIPSYGSGPGSGYDQVVAEIGGRDLTLREVDVQIQAMRRSRQIPNDLLHVYVPQAINQMITDRALAYEAERLGYRVSDQELANTLETVINSQFHDVALYKQYVEEQGMTVPEFEASVRESMATQRLRQVAMAAIIVTPKEVEEEYKRENAKVKVKYLLFSEATLGSQVKVSEEELRTYYEQHKAAYQTPPQRNVTVLVVDQAKVAPEVTAPEGQLLAYYNANIDQYRTPERVDVRHILLTTTGKSKAEAEKIHQQAEDLLKQLQGGADFAALAKKYSQDPGSAANGGELGWIVRGQTVKPFEEAAFSLKPKQLSGIVTTEYGYHILQVMDHQQAQVKPFSEVKNEIAATLNKQLVNQKMQDIANNAQAELARDPKAAAQVAAKYGLTVIEGQKLGPSDPVPGLVSPQLTSAIAGLQPNGVSQPVAVGNDKLAFAVCTAVIAPHPADFGDVVNGIRRQLTTQKALQLAAEDATKAGQELREGKDIEAVAKEFKVEVKSPEPFAMTGAVEGLGPATLLAAAFTQPVGSVVGPVSASNQAVVAKVVEQIPADMTKLAAQRDSIIAEIKSRKQREQMSLFEDAIRSRLEAEGKIKIHKDVIQRLTASYQS